MDKILLGLVIGLGAILLIGLLSLVGGTIVYWIWPHVMSHVFPGLVAGGMIAAKLAWWKAVLFTWMCGILFKGSSSSSNSSK